ncbi:MAG: type I-U CRISPR-associated RAMP protein Csb1/Cas7u [Phycisphaeraceae bacterium]
MAKTVTANRVTGNGEAGTLTLKDLRAAVEGRATALRSRATLQPAAGEGTKVFPPTYAGAVYATEQRRVPGWDEPVNCVLLDSVQSQANRMEEALQQAVDEGRVKVPVIEVDFEPYFDEAKASLPEEKRGEMDLLDPVGKVSSLQAPHRIADAILRDSELDGKPFRQSDVGKAIDRVGLKNATPLFELCPTALLLGMWDSTGPKGGLGAKFERAMVSEIVGIDAVYGVKTSSRIDPLGIQLKAGPLYAAKGGGWTLDEAEARKEKGKPAMLGKDGKPSEANHGNVTPSFGKYTKGAEGPNPLKGADISLKYSGRSTDDAFHFSSDIRERENEAREGRIAPGGVTIASAEQTIVLSLPALRRLRFPDAEGKCSPERDHAARTVLAALGLMAAALADDAGLDLRSRCLLYPEADLTWEVLDRKAGSAFVLSADDAIALFNDAVTAAKKVGLPWREEPLTLTPSKQLVKLVVKSQKLAAKQGGDSGEGGE